MNPIKGKSEKNRMKSDFSAGFSLKKGRKISLQKDEKPAGFSSKKRL
ncbi:hypothetical protein [Persicobacter diffluens]